MLEPFCLGAGEVAVPPGSSRHVCRRRGEGTEPELCQHLDASLAVQLGVCPGLSPWVGASSEQGEPLLLSPRVAGEGGHA